MADDNDDVIIDDDAGVVRWIPAAVVSVAFAGFFALAWYAYHSGTQSVQDEDLMVVEADKTPIKEKPLDPGGMKFPNQDKTIYDTFAAGTQSPPKVERVLPAPEEPINKNADTSETKTWINDKLKDEVQSGKAEQVIGNAEAPKPAEAPAQVKDMKPSAGETKSVQPPAVDKSPSVQESGIITHVAKHDDAATPTNVKDMKIVSSKDVKKTDAKAKPAEKPAAKASAAASSVRVQLGAYASEEEAKNAWGKIKAKFPELKDKTVYVVKADLGAKGVYYRLRAGVASADDAKVLCGKLTAKGQACITANN